MLKKLILLTAVFALAAFGGMGPYRVAPKGLMTQSVTLTSPSSDAFNCLYYSRSTDEGETFSNWKVISEDAVNSAAMTVSADGKVAIAWVAGVTVEGYADKRTPSGHVKYVESTDNGASWSSPVKVTDGYYPDKAPNTLDEYYLYAWSRDLDCAYDAAGNLHIGFGEGPRSYEVRNDTLWFSYFYSFFLRIMHWSEVTNKLNVASGPYSQFVPITEEGDTVWGTYGLHLWGLGPRVDGYWIPGLGCWNPQLAAMEDGSMVYTWTGQWDSLDLSAAGTINADIYAAISTNGGATWRAVADWTVEDIERYGPVLAYFTNLTNTHSPGARPGNCESEEYHSAYPWIGSDSILHITYIHDLFAGPAMGSSPVKGIITENPVMYLGSKVYAGEGPPPQSVRGTLSSPTSVLLTEGYQGGTTTYDCQSHGATGNRIAIDSAGNAHICWMYSDQEDFSDRCIYYNAWEKISEDFVWPTGAKVSGIARAGYTTMGVLSDGRPVVAFHHDPDGDSVYWAAVAVEGWGGEFNSPVDIDPVTVPEQPICPKIVIGPDNVIHIIAHIPAPDSPVGSVVKESTVNEAVMIELVGQHPVANSVVFKVSAPGTHASLKIYDVAGKLVETVFEGTLDGTRMLTWDASAVAAGVYFYYFVTPAHTASGRVVIIR